MWDVWDMWGVGGRGLLVPHSMARHGVAWHSMAWHGVAWLGVARGLLVLHEHLRQRVVVGTTESVGSEGA